jgi:hypothetical protein
MKTVIEMAREAGYMKTVHGGAEVSMASMDCLERFAELVRADERAAIIATASDLYYWDHTEKLIEAIRARSNT